MAKKETILDAKMVIEMSMSELAEIRRSIIKIGTFLPELSETEIPIEEYAILLQFLEKSTEVMMQEALLTSLKSEINLN